MSDSFLNFSSFIDAAEKANLAVVVLGGFFGGILQPVVAKLNPRAESPEEGKILVSGLLSGLLGVAAAGISSYILTDSTHTETIRLLFLAMVSGLAFPTVLTSAVDTKGQKTNKVQQEVLKIADDTKADGIDDTAKAAEQLRMVLAKNPPKSVNPEGQGVIETMAQQAVTNIAQTQANTLAIQRRIVDELKEIGTVAKTTGWEKTAQTVIDQLNIFGEKIEDKTIKAAVEQAVARLSDITAA